MQLFAQKKNTQRTTRVKHLHNNKAVPLSIAGQPLTMCIVIDSAGYLLRYQSAY